MMKLWVVFIFASVCAEDTRGGRTFSEDELERYNGHTADLPIYLAFGGIVYDVTTGAAFYGEGKSYAAFAGRACTRAVSLPSLDDDEIHDEVADFTAAQNASVDHWRGHFGDKYPTVGLLLPDSPAGRLARLERRRAARREAAELEEQRVDRARRDGARSVTRAELAWHGADAAELWLSLGGHVLDVSASRFLYGAGAPRALFAGAVADRALARRTAAQEDLTDDLAGLSAEERARLAERVHYFLAKFPKVGVLRDGPEEDSVARPPPRAAEL